LYLPPIITYTLYVSAILLALNLIIIPFNCYKKYTKEKKYLYPTKISYNAENDIDDDTDDNQENDNENIINNHDF